MTTSISLDIIFAALADPTRRAILERLKEGDETVTSLAAPFSQSQPAISQHIKVLESAKLVKKRVDQQRRPVSLNANTMREVSLWLNSFQIFWDESFDRLEKVIETQKQEGQ